MNQKHQDDRKMSPEVTKGVQWKRPENPDMQEDRRLRPDEPDTEARSHVRQSGGGVAKEVVKAEVDSPHRPRKFEPEDVRNPESGGLSRKHLACAGVRVGDPANTEGMNEGGRELEVQQKSRKKVKVKIWKRKRMKKFRNPNASGCEMESTSFGDSPKGDHRRRVDKSHCETRGGRRNCGIVLFTKPATRLFHCRAVADGSNGAEVRRKEFPCRNLAQVETVADGSGSAETKTEGGDATTCVFATRSISVNRKIRESGRRTEISPTLSNANLSMPQSGIDIGFKGEVILVTRPESGKEKVREAEVKTPEEVEDISPCNPILEHWHGNRNGIVTDITRVPETSGNGGGPRLCRKHEVRHREPELERTGDLGEFDRNTDDIMADKPEKLIVPEVVSTNPPEESRAEANW
ncbi:hypothetical protein K438DRAFT_1768564 [Mycena galopus ATCC 62051]|nr:hypothetical protein K438DRAFT_1768564 [Mycena galopus ATCC 62051]